MGRQRRPVITAAEVQERDELLVMLEGMLRDRKRVSAERSEARAWARALWQLLAEQEGADPYGLLALEDDAPSWLRAPESAD